MPDHGFGVGDWVRPGPDHHIGLGFWEGIVTSVDGDRITVSRGKGRNVAFQARQLERVTDSI